VPEKLTDAQLSAIVAQQIELAKAHDRSARAEPRSKALDYFFGQMDKYVPPEPNRSKVVDRAVADTVGWLLPDIMKVFTASDRMAIAEPVGIEDTEKAEEATDGLNYVFWKDNKGYEIVYAATWDSLLTGNGIVKTFYDDTPVYATSFHSGLTDDQMAQLLMPDGEGEEPEVLAHSAETVMVPGPEEMGVLSIQVNDLKIKRKKFDGRFVIEAIPPEEFLIDGDAKSTDEAAFTDHWQRKTRSDLVAMGYDKDLVWSIPTAGKSDTAEAIARDLNTNTDATDTSMELVDYHECFVRVDQDGDGEAELVRACYGGSSNGVMLDWEVWEDENPFDDIPCEPVPHRWDARSVADETMDIQDIKTVLTRQLLNNTYWVNNPQRFVAGKVSNPDQLDNPTFGGTVFGDVNTTINDLNIAYIGDKALQAITYIDEVRQQRTGVGRQSMALDPEVLQNQTAEASRNNRDAAYSQKDLLARNMAEWGWKKVFRKLMRLMIKHQDYTRTLMISGKEVEIDPRFWNADMDITINVGLGTGSRDRDLMMLGQVLQSQLMLADRFMAAGAVEQAIDMLPKIIATMTKMAESAGIRNPEDFYPEFTEEKVAALKQLAAQPKPDPALALEQAKGEVQMALKDKDTEVAQRTAEIGAQSDVIKNQAELEADLQTAAAEREKDITLATINAGIERERIASAERIKAAELQNARDIAGAQIEKDLTIAREQMANSAHIASLKPAPKPPGKAAN
jgi:hypothetical protein